MRYYWTIDGFTFRDIKRGWLENAFLNANRSAQDPFTYAEPWLLPLAIWLQCRWVCDLLIPRLGWSNGVSLSTGSQRRKWILAVSKPTQYVILSKGTSERINTSTHARCMRTMSLPTVRNAADAIKYHLNLARPSSSTTIGPTFLCYFTWWNDKIGCGVLLGNRPKSLQIEHALIFFWL